MHNSFVASVHSQHFHHASKELRVCSGSHQWLIPPYDRNDRCIHSLNTNTVKRVLNA